MLLRTLLDLPAEIASAFFFAASIGIAAGTITASHTHRLVPAFQVALVAFLLSSASFGYAIWRARRLRSRRLFRRIRAVVSRR
jgi:membrane protein implicated in regulation of membrane protease activity